jgi:polyketide biosynthesis enoyl-CoA hydratase PksH
MSTSPVFMNYDTIRVRVEQSTCFLTLHRPDAGNAINRTMVDECRHALQSCEDSVNVVVLEGLPGVFCLGADFHDHPAGNPDTVADPEALYDLWAQLARGPFVSIAHVRGKVNAGGVGFVAACDIVLADQSAEFGLSELLFGLFPACVLPFLVRRVGFQRAHYLTLTTKPAAIQQALDWGLVDASDRDSEALLRKHLLRLRHLSKAGISGYKAYMSGLDTVLTEARSAAIAANRALFSNPGNVAAIARFARTGLFPWEDN